MAEEKKNYELMVVISPQLMEQKSNPKTSLEALIKKVGGEVEKTDEWGEKTLSYAISGHDKGYYLVYQLTMKPKAQADFKKRIKLENGILRWLMLNK